MKKNKYYSLVVLIIALLVTMGGCTSMSESMRSETARTAIEQKYGEEFTVLDTRPTDAGGFYAWISPVSRPELVFRADIDEEASIISDNYPVRRICEDLTEKAEWALKDYDEEFYVFTENVMEYTEDEPADITLEKYLEDNPGDKFYVSVFIEDGADLDKLYSITVRMKTELGCGRGSVDTFMLPKGQLTALQNAIESYDEMDSEEVQEILSEGSRTYVDMDPAAAVPTLDEYKEGLRK